MVDAFADGRFHRQAVPCPVNDYNLFIVDVVDGDNVCALASGGFDGLLHCVEGA
jgi:hypothetical protein